MKTAVKRERLGETARKCRTHGLETKWGKDDGQAWWLDEAAGDGRTHGRGDQMGEDHGAEEAAGEAGSAQADPPE